MTIKLIDGLFIISLIASINNSKLLFAIIFAIIFYLLITFNF